MFAIKANRVSLVLWQPMIPTSVNTTHKQAHKVKRVKKLFPQTFFKITLEVPYKLIETTIRDNYQITFSSIVMELVTRCVSKLFNLSLIS